MKSLKLQKKETDLGGKMEFNISSVCEVCLSIPVFFFAFFPFPVVLTKMGVLYLTNEAPLCIVYDVTVFRCFEKKNETDFQTEHPGGMTSYRQ